MILSRMKKHFKTILLFLLQPYHMSHTNPSPPMTPPSAMTTPMTTTIPSSLSYSFPLSTHLLSLPVPTTDDSEGHLIYLPGNLIHGR